MKTILVQNDVVINIIKSSPEHNASIVGQYQHIEEVADTSDIKIGATWDGTNYTNPPEEPAE